MCPLVFAGATKTKVGTRSNWRTQDSCFTFFFLSKLHSVERHRRPPEASRVHQCHTVCWVGQLTFERTLFIIGARFVCKNPSTVLITLQRSLFNLAHTNDVDQLQRCGDAFVVAVHGKHARSKKNLHDKVADDGPDPPQREGGPTEENVRTSIKSQRMHHVKVACGSFVGLGSAGDPRSSSFQRSPFFSESYQGCSPIYLLDLSAGHTNEVGGASSRHVP